MDSSRLAIDSPLGHPEVERIVAPNAGPMTLSGTNTYLVAPAGEPAYVIDPGPPDAGHAEAVIAAAKRRGGIAGVLLTHSHRDHSGAVELLDAELLWGEVGSGDETSAESGAGAGDAGWADPPPAIGPFEIVPTPGHAIDHVCFTYGAVCFCGDLVLGEGSSFVPPDGGSLAAYLDSLGRLLRLSPELLCPGHGPYVTEPATKLNQYVEHRLDRERKLVAALADGIRSRRELLSRAWDDVPAELRLAAEIVMQAHLEKLAAEGTVDEERLTD